MLNLLRFLIDFRPKLIDYFAEIFLFFTNAGFQISHETFRTSRHALHYSLNLRFLLLELLLFGCLNYFCFFSSFFKLCFSSCFLFSLFHLNFCSSFAGNFTSELFYVKVLIIRHNSFLEDSICCFF